jgi:glycosyltransferase involved in cell wall biosynthesis
MDVLVLINNNLQYDTRVKRHVTAIAEEADTVYVFAQPTPNEEFFLDLPNLKHNFFHWNPLDYPGTPCLREMAQGMNVLDDIWPALPLLLDNQYYDEESIRYQLGINNTLMRSERWTEILQGIPEKATDSEQIGWVFSFYCRCIQWAKETCEIPADIVYCNDIDTLLCGVAHKKKYGSKLIYDFHDVFCDMFPGMFPRQHRNMLARFERQLIGYADMLLSVNNSMLQWVKHIQSCQVPGVAIYNCTDSENTPEIQAKAQTGSPLRIYYHGGCDATRGLKNIIMAVAITSGVQLILRCLPSEYLETLRQLVEIENLSDRVTFLEPVDSKLAAQAANEDGDIGIHACETSKCVDLECSLTNKFIEYLRAGLPVITSPIPEQSNIVEQYHAGWVLKNNSPEEISRIFLEILQHLKEYSTMSVNAQRASKEIFQWESYKQTLLKSVFAGFDASELEKLRKTAPPGGRLLLDESLCAHQEIQNWQGCYRTAFEKYQKQADELKMDTERLTSLQQQVSQIQKENMQIRQECDVVSQLEKEHTELIDQLQKERDDWKRYYEIIVNSSSWKITRPLRSIARIFKRG